MDRDSHALHLIAVDEADHACLHVSDLKQGRRVAIHGRGLHTQHFSHPPIFRLSRFRFLACPDDDDIACLHRQHQGPLLIHSRLHTTNAHTTLNQYKRSIGCAFGGQRFAPPHHSWPRNGPRGESEITQSQRPRAMCAPIKPIAYL